MKKGFYGRDKLKIVPVTGTSGTGEKTRGTSFEVRATVEDISSTRKIVSYREVDSDLYILVMGTPDIKRGYYLTVVEKYGQAIPEAEQEELIVQQATKFGGFKQTCLEVFA